MKSSLKEQDTSHTTKTLERIRPELNLEKWSIWQPAKSQNALKTKILERGITLADGSRVNARVKVAPTTEGALTTEDQKTYYALIRYWEENDRPDTVTFFSMRRLAKLLKKRWGTDVINSLTESLTRLRGTLFTWENSYFDNSTKETIDLLDTFNIISDLKIVRRKKEGAVNKGVGYFRFNDFVLNNLKTNHTKPLLFDVVVSFKSEIAQLLYVHLDLILNDKTLYERRTKELFEDLGLEGTSYKNPSNRKQKLEKALQELKGVPLTSGSISSIALEKTKDGKDHKLVVRKGSRAAVALAELEEGSAQAPDILPAANGPSSKLEQENWQQAIELVKYFYQLFHGTKKNHVNSKAADQAVSLIAQYGYEQARYVVEYARRQAPETNFQIQTFGGVLQYSARAIADYEEYQHLQQQRAASEAEETEHRRLEADHAQYRNQAIDAYLAEHGDELPERIREMKAALLQERRSLYSQWKDEVFTDFALRMVRRDIADELELQDFGDYYDQHRSREVATSPSDTPNQ